MCGSVLIKLLHSLLIYFVLPCISTQIGSSTSLDEFTEHEDNDDLDDFDANFDDDEKFFIVLFVL